MTSKINPKHYQVVIKGHTFEVADIMEAHFPEDMHLAQAFKYMMRAGRKPESSYIEDVGKCVWWCVKALMYKGAKHIEFPPEAPLGRNPNQALPVGIKKKVTVKTRERKTP